jgi:hypothetical protein
VSRGTGLDASGGGRQISTRLVKAEKRPAAFEARIDWAQKWLFDLTLASEGLPPLFSGAGSRCCNAWRKATDTRKLLAFNKRRYNTRPSASNP